jgi:Hemerythrin HHE cation binding domain
MSTWDVGPTVDKAISVSSRRAARRVESPSVGFRAIAIPEWTRAQATSALSSHDCPGVDSHAGSDLDSVPSPVVSYDDAVPARQSVVAALRSDHRAISYLLAGGNARADAAVREQLVMQLVRHFAAEEQYLYPAARNLLGQDAEPVSAAIGEHRRTERTLRSLESDELTAEQVESTLAAVTEQFRQHVDDQETHILGPMERDADPELLLQLGDDVLGAEEVGPTRPRPIVPADPTLNKILGLVEGFVDHVRDSYSHRGVESRSDGNDQRA